MLSKVKQLNSKVMRNAGTQEQLLNIWNLAWYCKKNLRGLIRVCSLTQGWIGIMHPDYAETYCSQVHVSCTSADNTNNLVIWVHICLLLKSVKTNQSPKFKLTCTNFTWKNPNLRCKILPALPAKKTLQWQGGNGDEDRSSPQNLCHGLTGLAY